MVYIITEDSNSAREFWKIAADTFIGIGKYSLEPIPAGGAGNTTLQSQVINVFSKIQANDILFVAFDNIGNTSNFVASDFLNKTIARCKQKNVCFKFTTYYCFEELYLSYEELVRLSNNHKDANIISFVSKCINSGKDYYNDTLIQNYIQNCTNTVINNREHFLNHLLMEACKVIKGHFKILKRGQCFSTTGECWVKDCMQIQNTMQPQQVNNVCNNQCQYCCNGKTVVDKLMDLNNKSIFTSRSKQQLHELGKI